MSTWPPADDGAGAAPEGLAVGGARYPAAPPHEWPAHAPVAPPVVSVPGTPMGPPDTRGGGSPLLIAGLVAVILLLAVVGVVVIAGGTAADDDEAASDTTVDLSDPEITAPPSEDPVDPFGGGTMPTLPDLGGPDPGETARPLSEVLPEIIDFVEETRGQEFATEPVVEAVPEDEFEALLEEGSADGTAELERAGVTDVALGLVPPGTDLADAAGEAGAVGVLGFYEPDTGALYVKGDVITPMVQMVIAHELTHALDDQVFDLARIDGLAERGDESAFGLLALAEGTASYVGDAYRAQLSPEEADALAQEEIELGFDQMASLFSIPPSYLVETQVPYATGQRFVQELVDEGGTAAVDAAYERPPTTSEQVMDADVYRAGEPAVALSPLTADGAVAEQVAFGAADLRLLELAGDPTGGLLDPDVGELAPFEGFGGGQLVSWTEGDRSCVRFEVVGDDEGDGQAILEALQSWSAATGGDVSTRDGGNGLPVTIGERCA